jgi:hypothetical protein
VASSSERIVAEGRAISHAMTAGARARHQLVLGPRVDAPTEPAAEFARPVEPVEPAPPADDRGSDDQPADDPCPEVSEAEAWARWAEGEGLRVTARVWRQLDELAREAL